MKAKQLIILSAIFTLLILGAFLKSCRESVHLPQEVYSDFSLSFPKESVSEIDLIKPGATQSESYAVKLVKESSLWRIKSLESARADESKIDEFVGKILELKGEIRGTDKSVFSDFKITDGEAFEVNVRDADGKNLAGFLVGLTVTDSQSIFIRKKGSDLVYVCPVNVLQFAGISGDLNSEHPSSEYWAAQDIGVFEASKVRGISIKRYPNQRETEAVSLIRPAGSDWEFQRSYGLFKADSQKVSDFLESFKTINARKIEHSKRRDFGFSSPVWVMTLETEGGAKMTYTAGAMERETQLYPIQISTEPIVYEIPQNAFQKIDQDDSAFFASGILDFSPPQVKQLTVKSAQKQMTFDLAAQKSEGLVNYLNDLKMLRVKRLIFDPAESGKVKNPGREWIKLDFHDGKSLILDTGETLPSGTDKSMDYAAIIRGTQPPFVISKDTHNQLFENLDRLIAPPKALPSPEKSSSEHP